MTPPVGSPGNIQSGIQTTALPLGIFPMPLVLNGEGGNDQIFGGPEADSISGGDGADILFGGGGNDTIDGGNGDDLIVSNDSTGSDPYEYVVQGDNIYRDDTSAHAAALPSGTLWAGQVISGLTLQNQDTSLPNGGDWFLIQPPPPQDAFGSDQLGYLTSQMIDVTASYAGTGGSFTPTVNLYAATLDGQDYVPASNFAGVPTEYLLEVTGNVSKLPGGELHDPAGQPGPHHRRAGQQRQRPGCAPKLHRQHGDARAASAGPGLCAGGHSGGSHRRQRPGGLRHGR